jgi:lipopolysaccharide export system protein LptA
MRWRRAAEMTAEPGVMTNRGSAPAGAAPKQLGLGLRRLVLGLALVLSSWLCRPGMAQGLNPLTAGSDSQPITITADNGIEWDQNRQVYVARGNAVAIRGTSEVHADVLTAHYRPTKSKSQGEGGNEVYRLDADGHVVIKGPNRTVVGDQAVYDVDQQIGIVTGRNLKLTTPTDVVTARDSLEWYDQQQIAVARGDAIAIRGDRRIRADILTAHFIKEKNASGPAPASATPGAGKPTAEPARVKAAVRTAGAPPAKPGQAAASGKPAAGNGPFDSDAGNSRISRVDAQGHVVVVTATDIGRGDYGVYNALTEIVTLLGNVVITRGRDAITGQYAVVDLNTNVSRIMTVAAKPGAPPPRVEGLFYRQDANHGPKPAQKPSAKPATGGAPKS